MRTTKGIWTGLSHDARLSLEALFAGRPTGAGTNELRKKGLLVDDQGISTREAITDLGFEVYMGRKVAIEVGND